MPNWCENILESSIPLDSYINESGEFDFELIKPVPEILNKLRSPAPTKEEVEKIRKSGDIVKYNECHLYEMAEQKTGERDWYGWSIKHWGVKWNCNCEWVSDDKRTISFLTPWGPPSGIADELSWANPDMTFVLKFAEPGMGFAGKIVYNGDKELPTYEEYDINDKGEGYKIACYLFGEDFFEDDAENED